MNKNEGVAQYDTGYYLEQLAEGVIPQEVPATVSFSAQLNTLRERMALCAKERERLSRSLVHETEHSQKLEDRQQLYREIFCRTVTGIMIVSSTGDILDGNDALEGLLGYRVDELIELNLADITLPQDHAVDAEMMSDLLEGRRTYYNIEKRYIRGDDILLWVLLTVFVVQNASGTPSVVIMLEDISARKSAELHLEYVSTHDSLTGLYNRAFFDLEFNRLQFSLALPVSIMVIDVDGLKKINDSKGHEAGDKLIISVAKVLKEAFRGDDIVARIGGDEFAAILPETDEDGAQHLLERINKCRERYNMANLRNPVSFSVGVATSLKGTDAQAVFKRADERMYADKAERKARQQMSEAEQSAATTD